MSGDRVRDEAERLVAAAIAAVSFATRGLGAANRAGSGFATGSPECCVCPVCRAIAALRDPAPEIADRLAAGVGDLAAGVTSFLRNLQRPAADTPSQRSAPGEGDEFWESLSRKAADAARAAARAASTVDESTDEDDPWRAATQPAPAPPARKSMAKKAVKKAAPEPVPARKAATPTAATPTAATPTAAAPTAAAKKAVAKKAVARKAVAKKAPGRAREGGA